MTFTKQLFTILSFGLILPLAMYSQTRTIPLWEQAIPNAIIDESYKEAPIYDNTELAKTSQVSIPTLSIYTPEQPNGTAIVICPGGGYHHLALRKEGFKVAEWLNSLGITAYVLKYRLPDDRIMEEKSIGPLQDVQEAMRYARRHAATLKINKIGIMGFSAGGHLASTLATQYNETVYKHDGTSAKPDFSILIYPVISMQPDITHKGSQTYLLGDTPSEAMLTRYSNHLQVNENTAPTFLIHATNDKSVPVENSINYYMALKANKVPVEMHIFEKGGHGFGLEKEELHLHWTTNCEDWLKLNKFMP